MIGGVDLTYLQATLRRFIKIMIFFKPLLEMLQLIERRWLFLKTCTGVRGVAFRTAAGLTLCLRRAASPASKENNTTICRVAIHLPKSAYDSQGFYFHHQHYKTLNSFSRDSEVAAAPELRHATQSISIPSSFSS